MSNNFPDVYQNIPKIQFMSSASNSYNKKNTTCNCTSGNILVHLSPHLSSTSFESHHFHRLCSSCIYIPMKLYITALLPYIWADVGVFFPIKLFTLFFFLNSLNSTPLLSLHWWPSFHAYVVKLSYQLYRLQQTPNGSCQDSLSCQSKLCRTN